MTQDCTYAHREDGIHEFVIVEPTRAAIDFWIATLFSIRERDGTIGKMLINVPKFGLPALLYMVDSFRKWRNQYPESYGSSTAVVFRSGDSAITVATTFGNMMVSGRNAPLRLFGADEYEAAEKWLHNQTQTTTD